MTATPRCTAVETDRRGPKEVFEIREMDRQWQEVSSLCVEYTDIRKNSVAVVWQVLTSFNASISFDECNSIVEALPNPSIMNCLTLQYAKHKKTIFS